MKYNYAKRLLDEATHELCTGPNDVRSRLKSAYEHIFVLNEKNFPDDLKDKWTKIYSELSKFCPCYNYEGKQVEGAISHTLRRIKNSTGSKIANLIWELYKELREY
jgi:hypothetical protein